MVPWYASIHHCMAIIKFPLTNPPTPHIIPNTKETDPFFSPQKPSSESNPSPAIDSHPSRRHKCVFMMGETAHILARNVLRQSLGRDKCQSFGAVSSDNLKMVLSIRTKQKLWECLHLVFFLLWQFPFFPSDVVICEFNGCITTIAKSVRLSR